MISMIFAVGENYELGYNNKLLWHLKNPISLTSDTLILVILSSLIKGSALAFNTSTLLAIKLFLITLSIYTLANLKCYPSSIF